MTRLYYNIIIFRNERVHFFNTYMILCFLAKSGFDIQFLLVPGHAGIAGNEFADKIT